MAHRAWHAPRLWERTGWACLVAALLTSTIAQSPPAPPDAGYRAQAGRLIAAARAVARTCGDRALPAAGPVSWDDRLWRAANGHASWLAANGVFTHDGPPGAEGVGVRTGAAGYRWRAVAENLAGGYPDLESAIAGWIESPSHCAALMGARYPHFGLARVAEPLPPGDYAGWAGPQPYIWVLVLGQPI